MDCKARLPVAPDEIGLLGEDLSALNWLFNNGQRTPEQDEMYPLPDGARLRIGQASWGNDRVIDQRGRTWRPIALADPFNGPEPVTVSTVSPDTGVTFFSYGAIHSFPSSETLAFAAPFFDLSVPAWALFHVKGCWEASLGKAVGFTNNVGMNLKELLTDLDNIERHRHSGDFRYDEDELRAALRVLGHWHNINDAELEYEEVASLFREMIHSGLYLSPVIRSDYKDCDYASDWDRSIWSNELKAFMDRYNARRKAMREGSEAQRQTFVANRLKWMELSASVADIEYEIEILRQKAWNIKNEWDRLFGESYLAFLVATDRLHYAETRVNIIEVDIDGGLTPERLEALIEELCNSDEKRAEMERYKRDVQLADFLDKEEAFGGNANPDAIAEYVRKCREVLKELKRLLHPDRWRLQPGFDSLTESQEKELYQYCLRVLETKNDDIGYHPGQIGWDHPSYEFLCRIRDRALDIFASAGVDIDTGLTLPGFRTIQEQIVWLEREITLLGKQKITAQVDLDKLFQRSEKREVARWKAEIEHTEGHDEIRDYYSGLAQQAVEKAEILEGQIAEWTASVATSNNDNKAHKTNEAAE